MARMSEEVRDLHEENREKKITARSARNRRGVAGKTGAVRLPSDFLSKKQLEALNGECVSYKLGEPMTFDIFCSMPEDLQKEYVKKLRKKFNIPDSALAAAMGIKSSEFSKLMRKLGIGLGRSAAAAGRKWASTEDCDQFVAFWCGKNDAVRSLTINYEGPGNDILEDITELLKNRYVRFELKYEVV